jgi:hypothetical protein
MIGSAEGASWRKVGGWRPINPTGGLGRHFYETFWLVAALFAVPRELLDAWLPKADGGLIASDPEGPPSL